jgi:hypothetical protein
MLTEQPTIGNWRPALARMYAMRDDSLQVTVHLDKEFHNDLTAQKAITRFVEWWKCQG